MLTLILLKNRPAGNSTKLMIVTLQIAEDEIYTRFAPLPGEIIYGGKQDRCVAQECLIAADSKPVKIEVYCVEHGRWTAGDNFSEKAGNLGKSGQLRRRSKRQESNRGLERGGQGKRGQRGTTSHLVPSLPTTPIRKF